MKTILITILLILATVATGHEPLTEKEKLDRRLQCIMKNQSALIDYNRCLQRCLNRSVSRDKLQCRCALREFSIKFCAH